MEDGRQELVELQETKIFTWELSVSILHAMYEAFSLQNT